MTIQAGKLRHAVTFQKPVITNTNGEISTVWTDKAKVTIAIMPQGGREFYRAKQVHNDMTHLIQARYTSELEALTTVWRIKFGSRFLNIVAINNVDERNIEWLITCMEAV